MTRQCGECTTCCKLLPMQDRGDGKVPQTVALMVKHGLMSQREAASITPEFSKPAGERCPHQRHHKGCMIYASRPASCRLWSCRWLTGEDTADLRRPDRSHYVIDITPDFIRVDPTDGNNPDTNVPVVQVWLDDGYPDAHKDPALRAYLLRRAEEGIAALIRSSASDETFVLIAPPMTDNGEWLEHRTGKREREHTAEEKVAALGKMKIVMGQRP
jgi:Putative zinc- or iron-chelating domain